MKKIKVMTVVGTRPEVIRLCRVMALLDQHTNHVIVHTGQNYDFELKDIFFNDLGIRKPDYFLDVNTRSTGSVLGETISKSEEIFIKEKPDALLILGDTNSCIAAFMAKRLQIPVYHMEAGNRCFDFNVPEETNRRMVDHIADFNLVYTEHARRNLIAEGLPLKRIYLTGSPLREVLTFYKDKINSSDIMNKLDISEKGYFLGSFHREENVDNPDNLKKILSILNMLVKNYNMPVIVSTHPRTKKMLEGISDIRIDKKVIFHKPFGFFDYVYLEKNALCTISDSGTISEESAILSFPAITVRNSMERPEAMDAGTIMLTGFDVDTVLGSIKLVIDEFKLKKHARVTPAEYQIPDTSWIVLKLILGTAKLSNIWHGVTKKS